MSVKFLYSSCFGRAILKMIMSTKALPLAERFMKSSMSKFIINPYIKSNHIDMSDFRGQSYKCFADFFARKKDNIEFDNNPRHLISPCDSLLSIFPITEGESFYIKDSYYKISDLIPDKNIADKFNDGYCFIFRLCGSDYHHFCYIDDCYHHEANYIEGLLHSVQPIACDKYPVYRLNRRMWSLMDTKHFGPVASVEVGALLVGGIVHEHENYVARRGEEMGRFELAGSTIVLFFNKDVRKKLLLPPRIMSAAESRKEIRIKQGQPIGKLTSSL